MLTGATAHDQRHTRALAGGLWSHFAATCSADLALSRLILRLPELQPVDIHEVLSKALDAIQLAVQSKHLTVKVEFSGHIRVNGDPVRIQQVFWCVESAYY